MSQLATRLNQEESYRREELHGENGENSRSEGDWGDSEVKKKGAWIRLGGERDSKRNRARRGFRRERRFFKYFFPRDFAVDLGTANTLIYEKGRGIILNEPSVVAIRVENGKKQVVAYGAEAKRMLGRTPEGVKVVRPIRTGVIADFDAAAMMLSHFLGQVRKRSPSLFHPRVMVGVPSGITEVEKRAIREALEPQARGAVRLIDEAMAAAIGCQLPVTEAAASLIVDVGGGTTDIAVVSLKELTIY
jgi:MreB/Mrl family cell shape determining protein